MKHLMTAQSNFGQMIREKFRRPVRVIRTRRTQNNSSLNFAKVLSLKSKNNKKCLSSLRAWQRYLAGVITYKHNYVTIQFTANKHEHIQ